MSIQVMVKVLRCEILICNVYTCKGKGVSCARFEIATSVQVKVKVNFALEQATKAQRGSRYIALLFLQPRR